jgi:hypothetical protein
MLWKVNPRFFKNGLLDKLYHHLRVCVIPPLTALLERMASNQQSPFR